jgi:putative nucleotidyltransferase with HDIG domain
MAPDMMGDTAASREEKVRDYYRKVLDSHRLPSLPVVASKVLEMIQDPDISVQKLSRALADDAALSGRVLTISRSPHYAQRNLPSSLTGAVQVLGFRTLRSVVIAHATQSLCITGNKTSERLWRHSLGVALAMRLLAKRAGLRDGDLAFLAGLMHDIGQMILIQGDPAAYAGSVPSPESESIVDLEQASYGLDHTMIGFTLLNSWNMDSQVVQAALNHHSEITTDDDNRLSALLTVANALCWKADLGFCLEPPAPSTEALALCGCGDEQSVKRVADEISEAYRNESALFATV